MRAEQFRLLADRELIRRWEPEPPYNLKRCFCRVCGSYLGELEADQKGFPVAASALDDDPRVRPVLHEHVAEKAPWYEIMGDAPRFPGHPPGSGPQAFRVAFWLHIDHLPAHCRDIGVAEALGICLLPG